MNHAGVTPKVSVCVVTYNHEKYIGKCLQSIVDQKTDFPFEVIVADDNSTDATAAILRDYAERYPDLIKPVLQEENIGPTQNYFSVHNRARGKYVAHLDGDDFCLPGKLARLVSYLDAHPDCRIVWHRMYILNQSGESAVGMPLVPVSKFIGSGPLRAADLAKYYGMTGCHSGSMYRASSKKIFGRDEEILDYFITLSFCVDGGYAAYIDEPYGVYRFFTNEMTLTKTRGNVTVGIGKARLMKCFLTSNPELAKSFAAQCVLEIMVRTYFRHPLVWEYVKILFACRTLPAPSDVWMISKMFLANRNTKLREAFTSAQVK